LFSELKHKLLIRIHDKEKDVRQQAAIALMNFRPVNEEDEEDDSEENVNDALIDLMIRDPSSLVVLPILHCSRDYVRIYFGFYSSLFPIGKSAELFCTNYAKHQPPQLSLPSSPDSEM
jgi:hypothetical protein